MAAGGRELGHYLLDEALGHQPDALAHPHRVVEAHGRTVQEDPSPVAGERDHVRAGAKPGLLALGGRVELALETLGHLGQLNVRETVVVDGRQPPDRGASGDQDEGNEQTGREAKPLHRTGL